ANLLLNHTRLGHHRSVDRMYRLVKTPYIFHCEDDWQFDPKPVVSDCLKGLLFIREASVICVRAAAEYVGKEQLNGAEPVEIEGLRFLRRSPALLVWNGFTFNPSLLRRSLWEKHGPYERFFTEGDISEYMKARGLRVVQLAGGTCRHIGDGRHVDDPFQAPHLDPRRRSLP